MIRHPGPPQLGARLNARVAIRSARALLALACLVLTGCVGLFGGGVRQDPQRASNDDLAALREASALAPSEPYWPHRLASLHLAQAQVDSALAYNAEALRRDPVFPPALSLQSRMLYQLGQHQTAVELLRAAEARVALSPALLAGLALHLERLEAYEEADAIYARLAPAPETDDVLLVRQLNGQEFAQALSLAEKAVERSPKNAQTRNNFGVALLYAGKPDEAKQQLLEAHQLDAELPGPLYNLAIVDRYYFFDAEASRQWLSEYLRLSSEDPDGLVESFAQMDASKPDGAK